MDKLIKASNLTKKYNKKIIFQNVSFEVDNGDSIAFIGHNGSGKSTLLKIIGKMVTYDSGNIYYKNNLKFSYVPEHFPKLDISALSYIKKIGLIEGLGKKEIQKRGMELIERYFMENMVHTPIKYLSKGSMQKVFVIQALLTRPDVLLLDEPLSGQDGDSQKVFIQMVREMNREGTAIIMSCHEKWFIHALSKTVYEIKESKLIKNQMFIDDKLECQVLTFTKNKNGFNLNEVEQLNMDDVVLKKQMRDKELILYIPLEKSNLVIRKMLYDGYELRDMHNENI